MFQKQARDYDPASLLIILANKLVEEAKRFSLPEWRQVLLFFLFDEDESTLVLQQL
jgi:hypothetical protein